MAATSNDRIDIRINSSQKELIKYASELRGFKSVSEFMVYCASSEASRIVKESNQILQSLEDKKIFLEAIMNPSEPNEALKKAAMRYNQLAKPTDGLSNPTP